MRSAIAAPCSGCSSSRRRIIRSSVPFMRSVFDLAIRYRCSISHVHIKSTALDTKARKRESRESAKHHEKTKGTKTRNSLGGVKKMTDIRRLLKDLAP